MIAFSLRMFRTYLSTKVLVLLDQLIDLDQHFFVDPLPDQFGNVLLQKEITQVQLDEGNDRLADKGDIGRGEQHPYNAGEDGDAGGRERDDIFIQNRHE